MINEKGVSYRTTNTYSTLNNLSLQTQNVWVVFHGIGYLSRYFLRYFKNLDPEENYIIAPQAPSKYYLNGEYRHVGASWATRENTQQEIENVLNYLDEVWLSEDLENAPNLVLFGYSQGVSIVSRWIARRKIRPAQLIFHSGRIPKELNPEDFEFLKDTKVSYVYGKQDAFVNEDFLKSEENRLRKLFPKNLQLIPFDGGHEVNKEVIPKFV